MSDPDILQKLGALCSKYPEIQYSVENGIFSIACPNKCGFPIQVFAEPAEYTITFGAWHGHFDTEAEVLGMVEFGLSDQCRLRVLSSGGSEYRWVVESFHEAGWVCEYSTGLFAWRFWLPQTISILQNHIIKTP